MAFDPTKPADGSLIAAAEMRSQLQGLHDEIVASAGVTGAQVDSTVTLSPGSPATAAAQLIGGVLHFDFAIPVGNDGSTGAPGEVTQAQLANDLANTANAVTLTILPQTSANSNGVSNFGQTASGSYDQLQIDALMQKVDELINALRR